MATLWPARLGPCKRERCSAHPSSVSHHVVSFHVVRRGPSSTSFIQTWRGGSTFIWHRQSWVTPSPPVRWRWWHTGHSHTRLRSYFNRSNGPFMAASPVARKGLARGNQARSPCPDCHSDLFRAHDDASRRNGRLACRPVDYIAKPDFGHGPRAARTFGVAPLPGNGPRKEPETSEAASASCRAASNRESATR